MGVFGFIRANYSGRFEEPKLDLTGVLLRHEGNELILAKGCEIIVRTHFKINISKGFVGMFMVDGGVKDRLECSINTESGYVDSSFSGEICIRVKNKLGCSVTVGEGELLGRLLIVQCLDYLTFVNDDFFSVKEDKDNL